ncbi:nucleotidyltransferase family protein [Candidatus Pelagibacter sp.]|nr:nucleotidyltransferase family protein [Candidatus Pelagibacter sp.]
MKINTALILCAGFGKRLNPLTLNTPKPLIELNNVSVLETCINLIESLDIKEIFINTFYLKDQIRSFIKKKNFKTKISIIEDGKNILDTGGGIKNMLNHTKEDDVIIFNPDTIWKNNYSKEIIEMEKLYFSKQLKNILLLVNKELSFDKNLNGDFNLQDNLIIKNNDRNFIYTGCQILNKKLLSIYKTEKFSINNLWNNLIEKKELYGFETNNDFYHLTDLKTFKKLQDL